MSKSLLPLLSFVNTGKQKKESCFSDFLSKLWESQWSVEMVCYEGVNGWEKRKKKTQIRWRNEYYLGETELK